MFCRDRTRVFIAPIRRSGAGSFVPKQNWGGGKRDHYIELLQSVASATPYGIRNWMCRREWVIFSAEEFIRASRFLRGEEIKLKLEGKSAC